MGGANSGMSFDRVTTGDNVDRPISEWKSALAFNRKRVSAEISRAYEISHFPNLFMHKGKIMKRLTTIFLIPTFFAVPAYAGELCQDEAKAMGYIGATEMLAPCKPQKNATSEEAQSKESRKYPEGDLAKKQRGDFLGQFGQAQTQ